MNAILMASLAAAGFSAASLSLLLGGELGARGRSSAAAFAAGYCSRVRRPLPRGLLESEGGRRVRRSGWLLLFMTERP